MMTLKPYKLAIWATSVVLGVWIIYAVCFVLFHGEKWDSAGMFGDTFGALNTLFSGLAFALLVANLKAQRDQMELQQRELETARNQLKAQIEEMRATTQANRDAAQAMEKQVRNQILADQVSGLSSVLEATQAVITNRDLYAAEAVHQAKWISIRKGCYDALIQAMNDLRVLEGGQPGSFDTLKPTR